MIYKKSKKINVHGTGVYCTATIDKMPVLRFSRYSSGVRWTEGVVRVTRLGEGCKSCRVRWCPCRDQVY
jgi:hypothetical protein